MLNNLFKTFSIASTYSNLLNNSTIFNQYFKTPRQAPIKSSPNFKFNKERARPF
ncbi:unnamed protein product [Meloidogyne enterolobii]|uniref:Uncharacterized protein n=1 Tax=Meloidogyne enterolobii TaxID=390850 RepID=A0ACB0YQZ4_MELEN